MLVMSKILVLQINLFVNEPSIMIFLSVSCPSVRDSDHGDGGEAVQLPVHHRGGPEEAAGGGQGGQHRGGNVKCKMFKEKIKCEDYKWLTIALIYKVQNLGDFLIFGSHTKVINKLYNF